MSDSQKPLDQWLAPEGAGRPLACLATTFSFGIDFFEQQVLGRFLGFDWKRDEGGPAQDLVYVLEQEEKLSETRVSVLVDRNWAVEGRSLRWDLLPVGVEGGVMHAKVSLLIWENVVRCVIGSANLTRDGYRNNLEAQIVLDATADGGPPSEVMQEAIDTLRELVDRVPGQAEDGPRGRAATTLSDAERLLGEFGERPRRRGEPRMAIVTGAPGRPVLDGFDRVWRGRPARQATVLSPYFDAPGKNAAAQALTERLARRGGSQVRFVIETEEIDARLTVKAPQELVEAFPDRIEGSVHRVARDDEDDELRRLHAKAVLLESSEEAAVLIGSSNFSSPGLGLGGAGNLEVNLVIAATRGHDVADAIAEFVPAGEELELDEVDWEPAPAEEEPAEPVLPWGFEQALIEPTPPPHLRFHLDRERLPGSWRVLDPGGPVIATSEGWAAAGKPDEYVVELPSGSLPFFVHVRWAGPEGNLLASWPVNVVDKSALPPPTELRELPVDVLIEALASIRPLYESVGEAVGERGTGEPIDLLDPLRRFSGTGQLMRRARVASQAFANLGERLERPAANEEALDWRLNGPVGPIQIATGLIEKADQGGALPGETSFLLAELALTISRVDWSRTGRLLPGGEKRARQMASNALIALRDLRRSDDEDDSLSAYVERAFAEATI